MAALEGLGVLVTRPEAQAGPLARRLASAGARVYRLPAVEVEPREDRARQRAALGPIDRFHWIVFISANAVRFGSALLEGRRDLRLAAVGPATAAALNHAGYRVALVPRGGFDSEHLLASPEFGHVQAQRVLIVRGGGGRELLAEQLMARGAEIAYAEVYDRHCARPALHFTPLTFLLLMHRPPTLRAFHRQRLDGWLLGDRRFGQLLAKRLTQF